MSNSIIFVGRINSSYFEFYKTKGYRLGWFLEKESKDFTEQTENYNYYKKQLDFILPLDFSSKQALQKDLKKIHFHPKTLLSFSADRHILTTSYLAEILQLDQARSFPIQKVLISTNKILQRQSFLENYPEITPAFTKVETVECAQKFADKHSFPLIIKPANLILGKLVFKCQNLEELKQNTKYILDNIRQVYSENKVHRKPIVMIEEFIYGKLYSIDSYISLDKKIVHTPICYELTAFEIGLKGFNIPQSGYPSNLDFQEQAKIYEVVEKAIKSTEIVGNVFHVEVLFDSQKNKVKIVEINLRSGGSRQKMLPLSYGINHLQNIHNTFLGKPVQVSNKLQKYCIHCNFWPEKEGVLKEIKNLEILKNLKSFESLHFELKIGQIVGSAKHGHNMIFSAILTHSDKLQLEQDLKTARKSVKFVVSSAS